MNSDDISRILARRYPHIQETMQLLAKLNKWIGLFKADMENGGNVEVTIRFRGGKFTWMNWSGREIE
jgi:hypothetical protein